MSIEFRCPSCRTLIRTPHGTAGKQARCPSCSGVVLIPGESNQTATEATTGGQSSAIATPPLKVDPPNPSPFGEQANTSLNPYATSGNITPFDPYHAFSAAQLAEHACPRLLPPAIGMLVFSITGLLLMALIASLATADPNMLFQGAPNAEGRAGVMAFLVGYFGLGFVSRALQVLGAIAMLRRSNYKLAMTGAICALIPCEVYCCLPNLPLGIWALFVLNNAAVKAAFDR